MLVVRPIGPGAGRYYEGGPVGTWVGGGAAALGLYGPARDSDVAAVLGGTRPVGGGRVLDGRPHSRRRAGWDLTFAAPKGVSLLGGLLDGPGEAGSVLAGAHRAAVDEALGFACRHALWVQRDGSFHSAADGLVAVRFEHATSDAGDPHLHAHVLVANLLRGPDGRWSSVASSPWWRSEREMGTVYDLGLRHHVAAGGLDVRWVEGRSGLYDVAGVPRAAVRAASRRQAEMLEHQARGWETARGRAARAATRSEPVDRPAHDWRAAVAAAGLDKDGAAAVIAAGRTGPTPPPPTPVEERLAGEASSFTVRDVVRALGREAAGGLTAEAVEARAAAFCAGAEPAPGAPGRWSTARTREADRTVERVAHTGRDRGLAVVGGQRAAQAAADPALDTEGAAAVLRLLEAGHGVEVLAGVGGADRLGPQAAILDGARRAWQAAGHRVAVAGTGPRWEALSGLPPAGPGPAPEVLIVDRADRLPPPELAAVVAGAEATGTKVVLVEGGTLPGRRRPLCEALTGLDRLACGGIEPPADRRWPLAVTGPTAVAATGRDAVAHLVGVGREHGALLVGAGAAEARLLNDAARLAAGAAGELTGPTLTVGDRSWQAGDRVIALRSDRSEGIGAGTSGAVAEVDRGRRSVTVAWDGGATSELTGPAAGLVGPGWATTPTLARSSGREVAVLGTGPTSGSPVIEAAVVAPALAREPGPDPVLDARDDVTSHARTLGLQRERSVADDRGLSL